MDARSRPLDDAERHLLDRLQSRVELVDRVRRALDLATSEDDACRIVTDAVASLVGARQVRISVDTDDCVALLRHGVTQADSSAEFDACGHLRALGSPVSAVCVPLAVGEQILGALQWQGEEHELPDETTIGALDVVGHLLALRLVLLRTDPGSDAPRTDPLTGLLNRRSTARAIRDLVRDLVPFSVAVCDLDAFSAYNDEHGHDVGDRALRLFAETLTSVVRPDDLVGRTEGDVVTVVFPGTSAIDAGQALERVREVLALSLAMGDLPPFTASCGIADSNQGDSIETIVETAELATALAKRAGANRVVIAGERTTGPPGAGL